MTKAQKEILHAVNQHGHITAENVHADVRLVIPNISLGTVYRNLSQFADKNIIRRVPRNNAPDLFDGTTTPHDHIICQQCGKAFDIFLPDLKDYVRSHINEDIISVELSASYICIECVG